MPRFENHPSKHSVYLIFSILLIVVVHGTCVWAKEGGGAAMAAAAAYGGLQVHSRLPFKADRYVRLQEHGIM